MERFLIELCVRGLVLCLLAAATLLLLRRAAAAYRHLICVLALCGLLTLPLAQRLMPPLPLLSPAPAVLQQRTNATEDAAQRLAPAATPSEPTFASVQPTEQSASTQPGPLLPQDNATVASGTTTLQPTVGPGHSRSMAALLLGAIWVLGAALLLTRLMVAMLRLRRLERESRDAMLGDVPILVHTQIETPLTWGIRRHVILLPAALLSADPAVCESALSHEQAHIDRRDWVWNLFAEIVCALCWFQPGAWWLRRRMRFESERACDDRVLLSGIIGPDYAAHLLQIVQSVRTQEIAPAMAHCGGMEDRMRHILDTHRPRRANRLCLAFAVPLGVALLSLAAVRLSARPAEAKPLPDSGSHSSRSERSGPWPQPSTSAPSAEVPGAPEMADPAAPGMLPDAAGSHPAPRAATPDAGVPLQNNNPASALRSSEPLQHSLPAAASRADEPIQNPPPAATPRTAAPLQNNPAATATVSEGVPPLGKIVWGKAVDGLEPGFMRITPAVLQVSPQGSPNSHVIYQVLVRNATRQERTIETQCQGMPPHWIADGDIKKALNGSNLRNDYSVIAVTDLSIAYLGSTVKLAPGEAVLLPERLNLYIGDANPERFPRVRQVEPGKNWIVQPILVRSLTPGEAEEDLRSITSPYGNGADFTILTRDGNILQRRGAKQGVRQGGKTLYAMFPLEIPGPNAAIPPAEKPVEWGEIANGFQLGARIPQATWACHIGDVIKFEPFGRNLSGKDISLSVGNYWKVNYKIQVQTLDGKPVYMERDRHNQAMLVAGYRLESFTNGAAKQISEAYLKITRPSATQATVATYGDEDTMVEAIPLKPGHYRVRLVSWSLFGPHSLDPASGWIPIEVKS